MATKLKAVDVTDFGEQAADAIREVAKAAEALHQTPLTMETIALLIHHSMPVKGRPSRKTILEVLYYAAQLDQRHLKSDV